MKCLLLLIALVNTSLCEKIVKFQKVECPTNPRYLANATCELKILPNNLISANGEVDLIVPLENVHINWVLYRFFTEYRPFIHNESLSSCEAVNSSFTKSQKLSYLSKRIMKNLKKSSNIVLCNYAV